MWILSKSLHNINVDSKDVTKIKNKQNFFCRDRELNPAVSLAELELDLKPRHVNETLRFGNGMTGWGSRSTEPEKLCHGPILRQKESFRHRGQPSA